MDEATYKIWCPWSGARGGGGGRYSSEFLVGVSRPVPQILTQFQTKISIFHTRFQTRPLIKISIINEVKNG